MNKKINILLSVILILIILCYLFMHYYPKYSMDNKTYKQYMWILKDSVINDIDTLGFSFVEKNDVCNLLHYKCFIDTINNERTINCWYAIKVWEFKNLTNIDLYKVSINTNANVSTELPSAEILNAEGGLPITVKDNFEFNGNSMSINLDKDSKLISEFDSSNYKGFYGIVNRLSLSDENNHDQIIFSYAKDQNPVVFFLYKGHESFYLISVNAQNGHPLDKDVIKMFNLK
jgi:hypothetical protein